MSIATKRAEEFLLGHERKVKKSSASGKVKNRKRSNYGGGHSAPKNNTGLVNLVAAANKKPEVMVKIPTRKSVKSVGVKGVANHIDYISRNGKLKLENNHGLKITGKDVKNIANNWQQAGMIHEQSKKQVLNVVLSMPPETDPEKVNSAARQFAAEVFKGHEYVFVLHTDEAHPHVHIAVTMQNELGQRLNPRKNDLYEWRLLFAEKMREEGVECAATKRVHRGQFNKSEKSEIRQIKNRNGQSYIKYKELNELKEAIKQNKRPIHPFLKEQLASRDLVAGEYKSLSKLLYQEGLKTEARIISNFAKEIENKRPITQSQKAFDDAKKVMNRNRDMSM
ncbi:hypothetical protein AAEX37_01080 [Oligella sp. MSHR50489EDL]|uniref:relaxase/mobilization nuclease domain-containing protein n=1 Tax=Oligella sp. MSHR50489EDL TaxID=3139409 RepID=UPI003D81ADE9